MFLTARAENVWFLHVPESHFQQFSDLVLVYSFMNHDISFGNNNSTPQLINSVSIKYCQGEMSEHYKVRENYRLFHIQYLDIYSRRDWSEFRLSDT